MRIKIVLLISLLVVSSCSGLKSKTQIKKTRALYRMTDKSGEYVLTRERAYLRKKGEVVVKRKLQQNSKVFEKSVTISAAGSFKGKQPMLRPKISQYEVWFDGKKYSTTMSINKVEKSLEVKLLSPESQWNGLRSFVFPNGGKGAFCFYSQVIECAIFSGFIDKAIEHDAGKMNLYIIWEGYPYFQEQYLNIPDEVFSKAQLIYDGVNKKGRKRFTLKVAGQSIFYLYNEGETKGQFWVAQGLAVAKEKDI